MNRHQFEVRQGCRYRRSFRTLIAKPLPEPMHDIRHITRERRGEDEIPIGITDTVLARPVLAGSEHWIDVIENSLVDLPHDAFVDDQVFHPGDLIDE
jgi:hypothetical protein